MKNLNNSFDQIVPVTVVGLGLVVMSVGISYVTEETKNDLSDLMGLGGTLISLGGGYIIGREYGKKSNENNYQTKPEDYQNK